jgi:elongation factor G
MTTPSHKLKFPLLTCTAKLELQSNKEKFRVALIEYSNASVDFFYNFDELTAEAEVGGINEIQVDEFAHAMENKNITLEISPPNIVYRGTVDRAATIDHTHKKQFGGVGQFARVILEITQGEVGTGFQFKNKSIGASVPEQFISGVERGLVTALDSDPLVRSSNYDITVCLTDGAFHEFDSSAMTFETAARAALRSGLESAGKRVLEPVMKILVSSPKRFAGTIVEDLNARLATVVDTSLNDQSVILGALVPLGNLLGYKTRLNVLSQGHANLTMAYSHYAALPGSGPTNPENFPPAMAMRA